jgi:hypothetical protein
MAKRSIKILGKLSDTNKQPIAKLRVEAWDKDLLIDDFVGEAISNEQGAFTISFTQSRYKELFLDRDPDIYFKIYDGDALVHSTENSVLWNIKTETVVAAIVIDREKEKNPPINVDKGFKVQGHIHKPDGSAFAAGLVHAYDKDLRTELLLGKAITNETGYYEIRYSPDKLGKTNKGNADLQVRVIEMLNDKEEKILVASEIFFNAAPVQEINLTLPAIATKQKSEWERVNEKVLPLLKGQRKMEEKNAIKYEDLSPSELTGTDIDFVVSETNFDRSVVNAWVASNTMFKDAVEKLDSEHTDEQTLIIEYGWAFFYGITRQDIANILDAVLQQPTENLKRVINAAIVANRIPEMDNKNIEQLVKAMDLIQGLQMLDPKQTNDSPFARILSSVTVPVSRKIALDALKIVQEKGMENFDGVLELIKQHPGEEKAVNLLVRSLRVNQLVNGHVELFNNLNARMSGDAHSIAPLATIPLSEWVDIAAKTSLSHDAVMEMQVNLEKQHPLTALGAKLYDGNIQLTDELSNKVKTFIKHDDVKAEAILKGQTKIKDDAGAPESETFLKNMGRFVRTGLNMEIAGHLMDIGFGTPGLAIKYGGDYIHDRIKEKIPFVDSKIAIERFIDVADKHVKNGLEFSTDILGRQFILIPDGSYGVDEPIPPAIRENLPTLPGLFGDMDECMCKPCESMLGQPAYLVDLLNLLKKVTTENKTDAGYKTGLDLLNLRRSDIVDLPLSCEYAEKEIPHIDIAIRILEKVIVPKAVVPVIDEEPIKEAYYETARTIYPWSLPFDMDRAQIKANLTKLNIKRNDLLFLKSTDISKDKLLAVEMLDLSFPQTNNPNNFMSEWQLLTQENRTGAELWRTYGLYPDGGDYVNLIDPASSEKLINKPIQDVLLRISVLLDRTGLELDVFEEMIATTFIGQLSISNRSQCKTSLMRLNIAPLTLEDCLNRIHRFVRLHKKLSDWSFKELDLAIATCQFSETSATTPFNREDLLIKLATIKRLSNQYSLPIDLLVTVPESIPKLCHLMGITTGQLPLLKAITGIDINSSPFKWDDFEKFCIANKRITETGLTIEQVAETLLTRDQLKDLRYPFNEAFKSDKDIIDLLKKVQEHINTVGPIQDLNIDVKTRTINILTEIFNQADAAIIVKAISDTAATTPVEPTTSVLEHFKKILNNKPETEHVFGEWFPLLPLEKVEELITIKTLNNPTAESRFLLLLEGINVRIQERREQALIIKISELSALSELDVKGLLQGKLLLDELTGRENSALKLFTNKLFLVDNDIDSVRRLKGWVDRLFRLKALKTNLGLENELLVLTERMVVHNVPGINWRNTLASINGATANRWPNINWQAIEDVIWLQQPYNLSRSTLLELFTNLEKLGGGAVRPSNAFQPLSLRLNLPVQQIQDFVEQIIRNGTGLQWLDATQLRKLFMWLMFSRKLNIGVTVFNQLKDIQDNVVVVEATKELVKLKVGEKNWVAAQQSINDMLRPKKRNALVAYLIQKQRPRTADDLSNHYIKNANDLYEHYLIDPLMEPCMKTTKVLEAITATQLFAQRILFGLEPGINNCTTLKQQWTWMRNYRVWEANRKVFLFPENWLYPELRDDKSSSFKQLESALGLGELNEDLANEVFGQFLDDVAQMGQVEVLGMYEDIKDNNTRRDLYVVGRSPNPPYIYFWRKCIDFGSRFMEWAPWQRIELDIQGDHVMPFILGAQLHVAWPLIKYNHREASKSSEWEVKLAWSRHDGKAWRKASISREASLIPEVAFSDEIRGFSFRCRVIENGAKATILGYFLKDNINKKKEKDPTPKDETYRNSLSTDYYPTFREPTDPNFPETIKAISKLTELITKNYEKLPGMAIITSSLAETDITKTLEIKKHLHLFCTQKKVNWGVHYPGKESSVFENPITEYRDHMIQVETFREVHRVLPNDDEMKSEIVNFIVAFSMNSNARNNFDKMYKQISDLSTVRSISCKAWVKLYVSTGTSGLHLIDGTRYGSFTCQIGQNTYSDLIPEGTFISITRLGDQPKVENIRLKLLINGVSITSKSEELLEVKVGEKSLSKQTIYFLFDSEDISNPDDRNKLIAGLDISLDNDRILQMASRFELTNSENLSIQKGDYSVLSSNVVQNSLPWMNGYQEKITLANHDALNPIIISGTQVLGSSPRGKFWTVGAACEKNSTKIWHFSDSGLRGYVDLDTSASDSKSELSVYADSYKDVIQYRVSWSQDKFLNQPNLIECGFSTRNLIGSRVENNTLHWIQTHDKVLASLQELDYESDLRFNNQLPYACYNWEVFFHAPLMLADQLSKQHKFEEAERWLRYIFDPTSGESGNDAKRFLKFSVFRDMNLNNQVINDLKVLAQAASGLATDADTLGAVNKLIKRWREMPFRPFVIARGRQIAFLWRTLFAYLDNLLAWADSLYRRDTRESINEAVMIYVLAQKILGLRPKLHEGKSKKDALSYNQQAGKWDDFANYWIDIGGRGNDPIYHGGMTDTVKHPSSEGMLYFCMPFNDKMLNYWNSVDERLFNIRHCRNIEGIERTLPLMDAPIDPELLIRAVNDGLNLADVINGLYAPPPQYRYSILAARATDLCNETKALGAAMLSAIEKRDAEHLSLLRSTNEISLLKLVSEVKTLQITEAERNIDALNASRKSVGTHYYQYQRLLGKKDIKVPGENESVGEESMLGSVDSGMASNRSGLGLIKEENEQYIGFEGASTWSIASGIAKITSGAFQVASSLAAPLPTDKVTEASKVLNALGYASSAVGDAFSVVSQGWRSYAEQQGMIAGHLRRRDEWAFQSNQTLKELQQIDKQILANKIRIEIVRKELSNHTEQMEQAKAVDEVMRSKFSNEQLYQWMVTQLSGLYFNAYRMTLEMARSAERAAARELGVKPLHILRKDYWDSLHMGLLAGDRLHQDLKRLEIAYLDQNRREYEMTKHISLRQLDPMALVDLRSNDGNNNYQCEFDIPEWLFDLDTPGHYLRRIKSVSVSIPCIAGPYTSVNCKLTLLSSHIRHDKKNQPSYKRVETDDDPRFTDYYGASEAIVTSNANGDSGLFETQLRDERFLPFEGSGVISRWRLELPGGFKQFNYDTISDVVLSMRYTARDGGDQLRIEATKAITGIIILPDTEKEKLTFPIMFSCRSDFSNHWVKASSSVHLMVPVTQDLISYWMTATNMEVLNVKYAKIIDGQPIDFIDAEHWPVIKNDNIKYADLGIVLDGTKDVLVLLNIGKKQMFLN